jgi:amidohydrolase
MSIKQKIQTLAQSYFNEIVEIRRTIHCNPELAYEEFETAELVCNKLSEYNIPFEKNIAKTGVVGILKGKNPDKKCIALRADMDALPILETNEVSYKSKNEGKMHACGHDVHTANLLGVAKILSELRDEFEGTVKFIFQPSEEKIPSGANAMIEAGVLKNPKPEVLLGIHVTPEVEVGTIGFKSGVFMASCDEIYITVHGKGGHAANPKAFINPIFTASKILLAFENITDLDKPIVLSFGKVEAKGATNIVPDKVSLAGTLRCFDENLRSKMQKFVAETAEKIATENNCKADVNVLVGYPVLINNEEVTEQTKKITTEYLGAEKVLDMPVRMGSEDFSYYTHHVPSCFYRLGVGNAEKNITSGLHTSTFNIDEKALEISMGNMAFIAVRLLNQYTR